MDDHTTTPTCQDDSGLRVEIHRFERIPSTNGAARAWAADAGCTAQSTVPVWVALEQTAGRGTRNRSWASPRGGLWLTMAYPIADNSPLRSGLSLRVGLAALRAARSTLQPSSASTLAIRWPNDIITQSPIPHKVGGCLVEHASGWAIVGIGINANNTPPTHDPAGKPLRTPAISLSEIDNHPVNLHLLEQSIIRELLDLIPIPGLTAGLADLLERSLHRPTDVVTVEQPGGMHEQALCLGVVKEGPDLGAMRIRTVDGQERLIHSGEFR